MKVDLSKTYVHLEGDDAHAIAVTETLWRDLTSGGGDARVQAIARGGWLVAQFEYAETWSFHEMHPNGDELVIVLDGEIDLELEGRGTIHARAGDTVIVPRGVWHRAVVRRAGRALHVTSGRGTEHRPLASR